MNKVRFKTLRGWMYRNARPLDLARWRYHFEQGTQEEVLRALAAYQNADGGFGHALEPDAWNPHSSPIQTWTATEILREIGFADASHPMIAGILRYLASGRDFDGQFWYTSVTSNNDYPHAPWWHAEGGSTWNGDDNPTACLAGFLLRFAERGSEAHALGLRVAQQAVERLLHGTREGDMHTLACYIRLTEYAEQAGAHALPLAAMKERLSALVGACITHDTAAWEDSYICKPSQLFMTRDSIFYPRNAEIAVYECEFITKTQLEDGTWSIPWSWDAYPDAWAVSKNWWKANGAILNLRYLRGMGEWEVACDCNE